MVPLYRFTARLASLLLVLILTSYASHGQLIRLDFESKTILTPLDSLGMLSYGDLVQIKIVNLNPALYKVTAGLKDTSTTVAVPFPTYSTVGLSDLTAAVGGISPLGGASSEILSTGPEKGRNRFLFKIATTTSDVRNVINAYQEELIKSTDDLVNTNSTIDKIFDDYNKYYMYSKLEFGSPLNATYLANYSIEDLFKSFTNSRTGIESIESRARANYQIFAKKSADYQVLIKDDAILKAADEQVKSAYQKLVEEIGRVKARVATDAAQKYVEGVVAAVNTFKRQYLSFPYQIGKNQTSLSIRVVPRATESALHDYTFNLLFPIDKKRFWGLSSGLYVSRLHNKAYSTQGVKVSPSDTVLAYGVVRENPGRFEFGASAMVRFGWNNVFYEVKGIKQAGWQIGFGPALAVTEKVRPRLLLGTGPVFGKKHKLILDIGYALGYVDRLSKAYEVNGTPYSVKPDKLVVSRLDADLYFSLSYLFLK